MPSLLSVTPESVPALAPSVTGPPEPVRGFPLASVARTVIVEIEEPSAATELGAAEIVVVEAAAAPGTISNDVLAVRPPADAEIVIGPAPCPVTVRVAIAPEAADVPSPATLPEPPAFVKVTALPSAVGLSFASLSSTAKSRVDPDARSAAGDVKRSCVAVPGTVVRSALVPVRPEPSVAVTVYVVSETVAVVNATEASPLAFVTEVVEPKEPPPPEPVFDQVTVRPARATGVPL